MGKKILVYRWKAYNQFDLEAAFRYYGYQLDITDIKYKSLDFDEDFEREFVSIIGNEEYDFVFSINYFTVISNACEKAGVRYVSYLCDSRLLTMENSSVYNKCNYIFAFDKVDYASFKARGVNIFYLPLAFGDLPNEKKIDIINPGLAKAELKVTEGDSTKLMTLEQGLLEPKANYDVSFVGTLYDRKNEYDKCYDSLTDYLKGYFDAALLAQMDVYGEDVFAKMMTEDIIDKLNACLGFEKAKDSTSSLALVFMVTHLGFKLANLERRALLSLLAGKYNVHLFSNCLDKDIEGLKYERQVDYWNEMPTVFERSKINLNITMRNIRTGLAQRIFDIAGNGGFVLSNYQAEIAMYFPEDEMAVYRSFEEADKMVEYYLKYEDMRLTMASKARENVLANHNYRKRVESIVKLLKTS